MNYLLKRVIYHFHHPNYLAFLLSLLLLIILPPVSSILKHGLIITDIAYGLVILMAAIFTTSSSKEALAFLLLGGVIFFLFNLNSSKLPIALLNAILTTTFFTLVFWKLMNYVLTSKIIDINGVFACTAGYLVLGLIGTTLFVLIEIAFPNAFNLREQSNFQDLMYYSYITITTVGFGDITPAHPFAKSTTVLFGILGQLYLTILVGIIIGKYLAYEAIKD